jgi:hypothetical protein
MDGVGVGVGVGLMVTGVRTKGHSVSGQNEEGTTWDGWLA